MIMADTKTRVQEIAAKNGMAYNEFAGRCLMHGLSYDTARDVWYGAEKVRGFNNTTKTIVARILKQPVEEVFREE